MKPGFYNVGSGIEYRISSLLSLLDFIIFKGQKENEYRSLPSLHEKPVLNFRKSAINVSQLNEAGWKAKVSIDDGLTQLLEAQP